MVDLCNTEEIVPEVDEVCYVCKFYLGPIVGICRCPNSEFSKQLVHPEGFCDKFTRRGEG